MAAARVGTSTQDFGTFAQERVPPSVENALPHVEHEVEASGETAAGLGDLHQKLTAEQAIAAVLGLARKVELRGEQSAPGRLYLDVVVARAALVGRRHDREKAVASLSVGKLVPAQAEARIVIITGVIGVPEINQRARQWPARTCEHEAGKLDRLPLDAGLAQVEALRRARLEERPLGLAQCRLVATSRRRLELAWRRRALRRRPCHVSNAEPGCRQRTCQDHTAVGVLGHKALIIVCAAHKMPATHSSLYQSTRESRSLHGRNHGTRTSPRVTGPARVAKLPYSRHG